MPFESGSLILANFTARVKETGEGIEATIEEDAKKFGIHDPTRKYEPRLVAVGDSWVLQGVDEALLKAEVGQKITLDVPPEKAFGMRDSSKVRLIPIRRFADKGEQLSVGAEVEVDGRLGIVKLMGSGRVQTDFNHRYAGKVIQYDIEVVKALNDDQEKIKALLLRRVPTEPDKVQSAFSNGVITLKLPSETYLVEGIQIIKRAIANDLFKYIKASEKVEIVEEYVSTKSKEERKEAPAEVTKPDEAKEEPPIVEAPA